MVGEVSSLSVVVPATDRPASLDRCLAAIHAATEVPDEVIVVDGPPELSAARARNTGVAQATGDVIVFVDADVEIHADALKLIREAFDIAPDLAAVFGSYDHAPAAAGTVSVFRNLLHHHIHHTSAGTAETFWTGLGAIRRTAFEHAGGFDGDRYRHPSVEDIELGRRLYRLGARIELDPRIQGTHLKHWTLRSMVFTDFARRGVPWVALQVADRRLSGTLNLRWRHRLSAVAAVVTAVGVLRRRPSWITTAAGTFLFLNRSFYALLHDRGGSAVALLGPGLHALHHLVGAAAVPSGIAVAVTTRRRPPPGPRTTTSAVA
jgi:glycosyltransferase involved in cell wall biosynthesis